MAIFIPLNEQCKKETVNESDNYTECSKNVAIQYQICFIKESEKSWYVYRPIKRMLRIVYEYFKEIECSKEFKS